VAITFNGTLNTRSIIGNNALTQNLFVVSNGFKSGVNMHIKQLVLQNDNIAVLTSVMPVAKVSRATVISGGVLLDKGGFDSLQSSDENIVFRSALMESSSITATAGDTLFSRNVNRMHTAVEQQLTAFYDLLPCFLEATGNKLVLRPGENLLVQIVASAINVNKDLITNFVLQCFWEEDAIGTFVISGTVTLSASPVEGARVMIIEADDILGTNAYLKEVKTTNVTGDWNSTIRTGKVGSAFVQYESGGSYYTASGNPYLQGT
jgi:hypothetical protein